MTEHEPMSLTSFQLTVANLFFSLPQSDGFLLAGGAALAAQQLITRPTQDLDLFTSSGRTSVEEARDAFEDAIAQRGWSASRIHDGTTFCRLLVAGPEDLLVDLALDSPPRSPAATSPAGPTFELEELAARKLLALFDRAEARDFADVFVLAERFGADRLVDGASQVDPGLDRTVLASMIGSLSRFDDDDIPIDPGDVAMLRLFFRDWRRRLLEDGESAAD